MGTRETSGKLIGATAPMSILLENPIPVILLGIIAEAVLAIMLVRSGRAVLFWAMAGVAALMAGGICLEWLVVTEVERVEATFEAITEALERNDLEAVLGYLDPADTATRADAARGMGLVEITSANITRIDAEVLYTTSPPTATAKIAGNLKYRDRSGLISHGTFPLAATVKLRKLGDRWLIYDLTWKKRVP